eukprot:4424339-Pleurochrysis_carterae.AAC.3
MYRCVAGCKLLLIHSVGASTDVVGSEARERRACPGLGEAAQRRADHTLLRALWQLLRHRLLRALRSTVEMESVLAWLRA